MDRDYDGATADPKAVNRFSWDVYHIENYLLIPEFLLSVLESIGASGYSEQVVLDKLGGAAREVVPTMLIHRMRQFVNGRLIGAINLGFPPDTLTIGKDLYGASARSVAKINAALVNELSEAALLQQEQVFRTEFEQSFADGSWRTNLPGREILRRFVALESLPVGYEVFRNLIVSKMVERGYKPPGMKKVMDAIVAD